MPEQPSGRQPLDSDGVNITRHLMGEVGLQLLAARGFTPGHMMRMRDSWIDQEGQPRRGVSAIELHRIETPETTAILVFRPQDMTIGFDLLDHR